MESTKKDDRAEKAPLKRVILLEDLDGEEDIMGGASEKLFFGEPMAPLLDSPFASSGVLDSMKRKP